ncbi:protein kinase [Streptomyces sp. NBC_00094]|uniref:protein kinase domain-containing protein n=1 Tax=Streptomyces sp. NBC_00094 TaxID=2903620 RepID=UPI00224FE4F9|nr:protein kinase [Streptomyces sp. NBC_00094]MCX5393346.1 protein kinase [Streptomyces sp. NBC_00094]
MSNTAHHIGPDSTPDRYRLLRSIGRGGEAVLYLAEIQLAGGTEPVVVKILDSKTTITPEVFERISQKWNEQAELLRFVHRPGVVGVREHFQGPPIHRPGESGTITGRALVLVMNHVDGLDLRDWRAERTLTTPGERREVMRTLEQLADVLDWLHSGKATPSGRTVVHGDLSPGNVMVDEHGQATLVDFGLSKLTADHQTAEVWFTPGYAAPEIFAGKRTPSTDRYAFGAIAYFLLSGESPPPAPEQLVAALGALPQIAGLPAEQRERVLSIAAADADHRPLSLSSWVKDVRHGMVSTTTSRPATVEDAVPPVPTARPVAAPAVPPAAPLLAPPPPATPPPAPVAAPVAQPPVGPPPVVVSQPVVSPQPPAAPQPVVPEPSAEPPTVATPGFGPPTPPAAPAPASTAPSAPAPRRRRKGPLIGAAAGVVLIAVLAVIGVQLLGAKEGEDGKNKAGGGASTETTTSAPATTEPTTEAPTEEPTQEPTSEQPTSEEPTDTPTTDPEGSASPTDDPGSVRDLPVADLTALASVSDPDDFVIGSAKIDTKEYGAALIGDCYNGAYVEYDLNREWKIFEFTAGIDDGSRIESARVVISVDDQPALFNETVDLGKPIVKSLNIEGALRLRLKVESTCDDTGNAVIAAPLLKR